MYDLNILRPHRFDSKVRIGKDSDGGYVLLREQVEATSLLLSFGVATDWSFERDFLSRRPGITIRMYDGSISLPLILVKFASKLAKFDLAKAAHYLLAAADYIAFVKGNPAVTFRKKFLATERGPREVTFDDILAGAAGTEGRHDIFVKLDIEGGEYDLLPAIARHADRINGIVIELHGLDARGAGMEEAMASLSNAFLVAHVHGNNYTGLIPGTELPVTLEVTLVNRAIARGIPPPSPGPFPDPVLDRACDPSRLDYQLNFS